MKKVYTTPVAKKVTFDYNTVVATSNKCSGSIWTQVGDDCNSYRKVEDKISTFSNGDQCQWVTNQNY